MLFKNIILLCICNHNPYSNQKTEYDIISSELLKNSRFIQRMKSKPHMVRLALHASETGGGERDRTDDPLLAKQVLSQLSYTPKPRGGSGWTRTNDPRLIKTVL
jgi:hypothetical protein